MMSDQRVCVGEGEDNWVTRGTIYLEIVLYVENSIFLQNDKMLGETFR